MNYNDKKFKPVSSTDNGEVAEDTIFEYKQDRNILTSNYAGGQILSGHLIGLVAEDGTIDMRYHQINRKGELMTGTCTSTPEIMPNGKIRLHENWQWTSGDQSSGKSVLEEI
ncbi:MAG: n-acetylglutamate synthase [Crocinitomicaceae bacterium]